MTRQPRTNEELRDVIYEGIWKHAVSSQMALAELMYRVRKFEQRMDQP